MKARVKIKASQRRKSRPIARTYSHNCNFKSKDHIYSTEMEIRFINKLGDHAKERSSNVTHLQFLKRYREAAVRREYWDTIDADKVLMHLDSRIRLQSKKMMVAAA